MDFLLPNFPVFGLDIGDLNAACHAFTCDSFNTACRIYCGTVTCGKFSCLDVSYPN
jgi:hypothetical protein